MFDVANRREIFKNVRQLIFFNLGTVYKPRRQVKGEGVAQMSTLLNKDYLVKCLQRGVGVGKNAPNSVYVVCTQPLN